MGVGVEKLFGVGAGKVWDTLSKKGGMSATQVAKETKLKINEVYGALGWLAREGKICADKKKTATVYSLC